MNGALVADPKLWRGGCNDARLRPPSGSAKDNALFGFVAHGANEQRTRPSPASCRTIMGLELGRRSPERAQIYLVPQPISEIRRFGEGNSMFEFHCSLPWIGLAIDTPTGSDRMQCAVATA